MTSKGNQIANWQSQPTNMFMWLTQYFKNISFCCQHFHLGKFHLKL